jgi:small subunit ribosomal protein S4
MRFALVFRQRQQRSVPALGAQARGRVDHGVVTIASYQCKAGDVITVREKAKKQLRIQSAMQIATQVGLPEWVDVNGTEFRGVFKSVPGRDEILPDINENLVVELYSK